MDVPRGFSRLEIERFECPSGCAAARRSTRHTAVERFAGFPPLIVFRVDRARFFREQIKEAGHRAEGRRRPVRRARDCGTDALPFTRRLPVRHQHRPTVAADSARPRHVRDERFGEQHFSSQSVEHVEESISISLDQQSARLAMKSSVDEHWRLVRVPVVEIMGRELIVPLQPPCIRIEREHRGAVQVVALALISVVVGTRIARGPVEQPRLRIVRTRQPRRGASVLDRAANPRLRAVLTRRRHRPESPDAFAGRRTVSVEKSADAFVSAGYAGDHEIVDDQRRAGGAVVLPRVGHLDVPQQLAGVAVQRDHVCVVRDHEHAVAEGRNASIDPAGRVTGQPRRARAAVMPDPTAAAGIERERFVDRRDVHDAVDDDRRRLQRTRSSLNREHPFRREALDRLRVDLIERAESIPAQVSMVGRPLAGSGPRDVGEA